MSTTEDQLRQMLLNMDESAPMDPAYAEEIGGPIPMMAAEGDELTGMLGGLPEEEIEGFTPGLSEEEALGLRADIALEERPASRAAQDAYHAQHGDDPNAPQALTPEKRVNPFAPQEGEGPQRKNPFAPDQEVAREVDFPTKFPMERGTSRASLQMPELGSEVGTKYFFENADPAVENLPAWAQLGLTSAILTTTDPNEIAEIFTQTVDIEDPQTGEIISKPMFPHLGIQTAPDGTLIVANRSNGQQAIINRPGFSKFDAAQMVGIGAAYTPVGRGAAVASGAARIAAKKAATETAKRLALRQARKQSTRVMVAGSAATEAALQGGQELAGGEFNPADVVMSGAFGVVPDLVFDPLARTMTKIPSYLKDKAGDVVPQNIKQAIEYAGETGRRLMTQDALQERMTPALQIFTKVVERIPIVGTGRARKQMIRERVDSLTELAAKYGIDVETNYGTKVMENFVDRMKKRHFWGANEKLMEGTMANTKRAREMLERAWVKEADEITDGVLKKAIQNNNIDDIVVDEVIKSGNQRHLRDLFNKLMPEGKAAARRRFLLQGLENSSWTPGSPGIADPKKFLQYLDTPNNKRLIKEWFSPEDQQMIGGMREYLRLTASADKAGQGAGMVAAGTSVTVGASAIAGFFNLFIGAAGGTAAVGHAYQSKFVRDRLLKLAHTAGDEAQTARIMEELRPYVIAGMNQWKQDNYTFPEVNITKESLKEGGEDLMYNLEDAASDMAGSIGQIPDKIVRLLKGE